MKTNQRKGAVIWTFASRLASLSAAPPWGMSDHSSLELSNLDLKGGTRVHHGIHVTTAEKC